MVKRQIEKTHRRLAIARQVSPKIAQPFKAGNSATRTSKSRQGRQAFSFVPDGTGLIGWTLYPAINGWAIFKRIGTSLVFQICMPPI